MRKILILMSFIVFFCLAGGVYAGNGTVPTSEEQNGSVKYVEQEFVQNYEFRGQKFKGSSYTDNVKFDAVKRNFEESMLKMRYNAYVFGQLLENRKNETYRKEYAKDVEKMLTGTASDICDPIGLMWDKGVSSTKVVSKMQNRVEINSGKINGLWMEEHGLNSVTVRVEIDKLDKSFSVLNKKGDRIPGVFLTSTGDREGLQKKETTKLVTVSYSPKYHSYGILVCPDIYGGKLISSSQGRETRQIDLNLAFTELTPQGAEEILSSAFNFGENEIQELMN